MAKNDGKMADLTDHLAEFRIRLIRSIIYVVLGTVFAWVFYDQLFYILTKPMTIELKNIDSRFLLTTFAEGFMIRMQICIVAGIILSLPFICIELWGFVAPGLTQEEKRPVKWIAPMSIILFFVGVVLCYLILPAAFKWFISYIPKGAELRPSVQANILFTVKMLLAFGLVFQLPVVLMLLGKVGIINSKMLRDNWRIAMVVVSIVAAVATPSNDAFSMLMMAIPVVFLYFFSILLVKSVEQKNGKA